ncbi:Pre-mRNA-splicing factor CLF1 [Pelomyxa schiedti]|nr:Pre-mRNA-splicing factor CLF1 [Pelomyxa schiedti]
MTSSSLTSTVWSSPGATRRTPSPGGGGSASVSSPPLPSGHTSTSTTATSTSTTVTSIGTNHPKQLNNHNIGNWNVVGSENVQSQTTAQMSVPIMGPYVIPQMSLMEQLPPIQQQGPIMSHYLLQQQQRQQQQQQSQVMMNPQQYQQHSEQQKQIMGENTNNTVTSPRGVDGSQTITSPRAFNAHAPAYIPVSVAKSQASKVASAGGLVDSPSMGSGPANSGGTNSSHGILHLNMTTPLTLSGLGTQKNMSIVLSPLNASVTSPRNASTTSPRNLPTTSPRTNSMVSPRVPTLSSPRTLNPSSPSYTPPGSPGSSYLQSVPYTPYTVPKNECPMRIESEYQPPIEGYYEDNFLSDSDYQETPRSRRANLSPNLDSDVSSPREYIPEVSIDEDDAAISDDRSADLNGYGFSNPGAWQDTNHFRPEHHLEARRTETCYQESVQLLENGLDALNLLDEQESTDGTLNDHNSIDMGLWGSTTKPLDPHQVAFTEENSFYSLPLLPKSPSAPFIQTSPATLSKSTLRKQSSFPLPTYRHSNAPGSPTSNSPAIGQNSPTMAGSIPSTGSPPLQLPLPLTSQLSQEQDVRATRVSRSLPSTSTFIQQFLLKEAQTIVTDEMKAQYEPDQGQAAIVGTEMENNDQENNSFSYFSGFQPPTTRTPPLMPHPYPAIARAHSADNLLSPPSPPVVPNCFTPPLAQTPTSYSLPRLQFVPQGNSNVGKSSPPPSLSPRSQEQQTYKPPQMSPRSQDPSTKFAQSSPRGEQAVPYKLPLSSPRSVDPLTGYKLQISPRYAEHNKLSPRSMDPSSYRAPLCSPEQVPQTLPKNQLSPEQISWQQRSPRGTNEIYKPPPVSPRSVVEPQMYKSPDALHAVEMPQHLHDQPSILGQHSPRGEQQQPQISPRQPHINSPTVQSPPLGPASSPPPTQRNRYYTLDLSHQPYDLPLLPPPNGSLPLSQDQKQFTPGINPGITSPRGCFIPQVTNAPASIYNEESSMNQNKRGELVESPTSRLTYKMFYRKFKQTEKDEGLKAAVNFALRHLITLPHKVHWRVYLEMADMAKRENVLEEARDYYEKVTQLQPYASQGWLEYAKMEEECGKVEACRCILARGLNHCSYNESLMLKAIKLEEKLGNLDAARALLSRVKHFPVEKTWKTMLEGALLEARNGNIGLARHIFKYLIRHAPWFGPIYQEAYRFEEKYESYDRAVAIVETGLKQCTRYGPLWFSALRIHEKISKGNLEKTRQIVERAVQQISKELVWKIYFEAAQIEDRAGNIDKARDMYVRAVYTCPENLLWKVWLGGARTELGVDGVLVARMLVRRALQEVPLKMRPTVLLDKSRLEEYAGDIEAARGILFNARKESSHEWKVFLESVLLEIRAGNIPGAILAVKEALKIHTATGRLWAVFIQLKQPCGSEAQMKVFQKALREVPKSGEVWCEGARIYLSQNDFKEAKKALKFAIQFTPQYGDSFIECLHRKILCKGISCDTRGIEQRCINAEPNYGPMWLHCKIHPLDSSRQVLRTAKQLLITALADKGPGLSASSPGLPSSPLINQHEYSTSAPSQPSILTASPTSNASGNVNGNEASPPKGDDNPVCLFNLNAIHQCHSGTKATDRRKLIFGSDQIKP